MRIHNSILAKKPSKFKPGYFTFVNYIISGALSGLFSVQFGDERLFPYELPSPKPFSANNVKKLVFNQVRKINNGQVKKKVS